MTNTIKVDGSTMVIVRTRLYSGGISFTAYEPSVGGYASESHSSLFRIGDTVYGAVASRRLPSEIDALKPGSDERYHKAHAWIARNKRIAEGAILASCPEAENGVGNGLGDITVYLKER